MSTLSVKQAETYTQRYEALLHLAKAMAVCRDCEAAEDVLTKELRQVADFDYLHLVAFENDTRVVSWELLHVNGRTLDVSDRQGFLRDAPTEWVHESQQPFVTADWQQEQRFPEHREFLKHLGVVSTCSLPLARGARRLGVLSLGSMRAGAYPEEETRFLHLLASQLAIALVRHHNRSVAGHATRGDGRLRQAALRALPFELTASQNTAIGEIEADMAKPERMIRLLQGDVGSGKTVVAFLAMLIGVEAGAQAALMAPTELLARQHHATIAPLAKAAGVRLALLTGRDSQKQKKQTLQGLADGSIPLVVGTHALVQEEVAFADLALAVVDEQHRFGVHQRMALSSKGHAVDLLVMTATPIPRTLMLAAYGDLDVSKLTEKPAGRQPIDTRTIPLERIAEVVDGIGRQIAAGAGVYWVCPLIEESEEVDLANVEERFRLLSARFPGKVGLLHGRLKGAERDATMAAFADGRLSVLVATTVIEVGVDVPAATVMVIEHAERFGLAQLHQLRGRVGRGAAKSTCLLLYVQPVGETAKARLAIMRETEDGFRIAEEDLRLRGAGELLGTRQSGLPDMRLADLAAHAELLQAARDDARLVIDRDPDLQSDRGAALRALLYLFRRDDAVRTLRAG